MAEVRGDNAGCPRCGAPLHCGAAEASCECAQLRLDDATRAALARSFVGCLCMSCLRALQADGSGALAGESGAPHP